MALAEVTLRSKALMCVWLAEHLHTAIVPESHVVQRGQWVKSRGAILDNLMEHCKTPIIVRSSAPSEDRIHSSQAGRYLSVRSVTCRSELESAIDSVFASYDSEQPSDLLFAQTMTIGADCVGVAFTADPETGSPYLIVNYSETGNTDAITSGKMPNLTWISIGPGRSIAPVGHLAGLPDVVSEVQALCGMTDIDVEFAIKGGQIYIFQVRALSVKKSNRHSSELCQEALEIVAQDLNDLQKPPLGVVGTKAIWGVMPDWNPAEIIGIKPRPLAVSLYRALITDKHWSKRRSDYGYRSVTDVQLLRELAGAPYIDVRASFNSLVPSSLSDKVACELIDAAISHLDMNRELHDKVEFRVLPTCFTPDLHSVLTKRFEGSLSSDSVGQITEALRDLTGHIISNFKRFDYDEEKSVSSLKERRHQHSHLPGIQRLNILLADAAELGTVPFVGQARRAFISIDMLQSFVRAGRLTRQRFSALLASADTIASAFQRDRLHLSKADFLGKYGHLRPGTYDITAPRYDRLPDHYFSVKRHIPGAASHQFLLTSDERKSIESYLSEVRVEILPENLLEFIVSSIAAREQTKFEFTKNISEALEIIADYCGVHGISREDASFLRLPDIVEYANASDLRLSIIRRKEEYEDNIAIKLPALIGRPEELWSFNQGEEQPNFVGTDKVIGVPLHWPSNEILDGAILLIESADPGFDWIFGTKMAGFVTMFGGPNSHMAIRAHELGVTAVIGAGLPLFQSLKNARLLAIDPAAEKTEAVL